MKKVYIFYDKESSPSIGEDFFSSVYKNIEFKPYFFDHKEEVIMTNAYDAFIDKEKISVLILDEKNNVLSTQNYDLEIAKDPLWLYFLITRFI